MRVSVVQMNSGHVKADNIAQARDLIEGAMADRPDLIGLPEVWTCLGGDRAAKFEQAEALPATGSEAAARPMSSCAAIARSHGIHVHGGSIVERAGDRLFNTTVVFDPEGARTGALPQDPSVRHRHAGRPRLPRKRQPSGPAARSSPTRRAA